MSMERKWVIEPFVWEAENGVPHFDLVALCLEMGLPATKENQDRTATQLQKWLRNKHPKCEMIDVFDSGDEQPATMAIAQRFEQQCETMHARAQAWRKAHPDKQPIIQWNIPPKVAVISTISDAIKHHIVSTNDAGLELIKALWPWGVHDEPTILMVRIVIEREPTSQTAFRSEVAANFE